MLVDSSMRGIFFFTLFVHAPPLLNKKTQCLFNFHLFIFSQFFALTSFLMADIVQENYTQRVKYITSNTNDFYFNLVYNLMCFLYVNSSLILHLHFDLL